jgi:dihydrofolate reductase
VDGPKTQYYTATSLDGFIADEHNSLSWLDEIDSPSEADDGAFAAFFADVGAFAMGATTYEWVVNEAHLLDNPDKWTLYYGETPCWVLTHRDLEPVPDAAITFAQGDIRPIYEAMLDAAAGRNIWVVGGGDLAGQFADAGLLDELIVDVTPVTLGAGAPLMPRRLTSSKLELIDVVRRRQFARLVYRVLR